MSNRVDQAVAELQAKTLEQIQRETAVTWAYRAHAAKLLQRPKDYCEFEHEALEHAVLCGDDRVIAVVRYIVFYGHENV